MYEQYLYNYNSYNASSAVLWMTGLPPLLHLTKSETDGIEEHEGDRGD